MNPDLIAVLTWIFRGLIGLGALASSWFFLVYLKVADLSSAAAKMLLALNGAIALVLSISFARHFVPVSLWVNILFMIGFAVVDLMLFVQIYLLYTSRDDD